MFLKAVFMLGTNILLLRHTDLGITAVLIGGIAGNVAFFLCTVHLFIKNLHFKFLHSEVKGILKFSIPLVFVGLGGSLLTFGDRYVLGILQDFGQVGIYTLAHKVASVVNLFVLSAINLAVLPLALKSFHSEEGRELLKQIMTYLTAVLCFMFLCISIFSLDVLKIFSRSDEYLAANAVIPILLFAYVFDGLRIMFSYHIVYIKKTQWNAYITIISSVVNIGLNFLVIPRFGYMGAALTTLLSALITCFAYQKVSLRAVVVDYSYGKIYKIVALSILYFGTYKVLVHYELAIIYVSLLIVVLFPLSLWLLKIIDLKDFGFRTSA